MTKKQQILQLRPTVPDDSNWDAINEYLERNFTWEMPDKERSKILQDFPKPSCKVFDCPKVRWQDEDPD